MKQIINREKVKKRALLANTGSIGGLMLLLVSVLLPLFLPGIATISGILMVVGLGIAMIGIYFANRWVKKPRPEDVLAGTMKGLGDDYVLFSYPEGLADHVILTPSDLKVIETVNIGGEISFKNGKWKERMNMGRAMRYIVEEHLGDPVQSVINEAEKIKAKVNSLADLEKTVPVQPIVVFTHPGVLLDVKDTSVPVTTIKKVRKYLTASSVKLSKQEYDAVFAFLEQRVKHS